MCLSSVSLPVLPTRPFSENNDNSNRDLLATAPALGQGYSGRGGAWLGWEIDRGVVDFFFLSRVERGRLGGGRVGS